MTTAVFDIETLTAKQERQLIKAVSHLEMQPGRCIVRKLGYTETTKGGIVLPETTRNKPKRNLKCIQAKVLNAPKLGRDRKPSRIRIGDTIIYNSYNLGKVSVRIDMELVELPVIREMDIDAVVHRLSRRVR